MYKISQEDAKILRQSMEKTNNTGAYARLQAVALRGEGFTNDQISTVTGYNSNYVTELCKTYTLFGLEALASDGRTGGNNRHMGEDEAAKFLEQFREQAEKGQVISVEDIAKAYDEAVDKEHKSLSSIYYFLHRHGWRKVMPKKQHPRKASDEVIEASKKLTLNSKK